MCIRDRYRKLGGPPGHFLDLDQFQSHLLELDVLFNGFQLHVIAQVPQKVARGLHNPNVVATFGLCISNVAPSRGKVGTAATVNWWNPTVTPKRASPATAQSKSWKSFPSWKGAA